MASRIYQTRAKIIKNIAVAPEYYKMLLRCPGVARSANPGQFIEVRVSDSYTPLLRRPFSIHQVKGGGIEILYEVVGEGTEILSARKAGECLDLIGPLGSGFNYELSTMNRGLRVLVAGGIGVAPLLFLAERLAYSQKLSAKRYPLSAKVLIGAKNKKHILCENDFRKLGCEVKISTDDGSRGLKGRVTDLLKPALSADGCQPTAIYACGPKPMLKEIAVLSKDYNIPAQVSLEAHMACGIGACLGCAVNTIDGYKRACKEGPVFNSEEIIW